MKGIVMLLAVVVSTSVVAGCVVDRHGRYSRNERRERDDAWDIVRRDPCRYREYEDFAHEHKNPEKRRAFVERLAREGCSRRSDHSDYRYDDPNYDPYR